MYITKVELHRFKRYKDDSIELNAGLSLVVGANNSGKSTILQALAAWQFCKTLVEIEKGRIGWRRNGNSRFYAAASALIGPPLDQSQDRKGFRVRWLYIEDQCFLEAK